MPKPAPQSSERTLQDIYDWGVALGNPLVITGSVATHDDAALPENFVFEFIRASDSPEMHVNGAVGDLEFEWEVPVGRVFMLTRVNWRIQDASVRADGFGGLAALAEGDGCLLQIIDADTTTVLLDFMDGEEIRRHHDFNHVAGVDVDVDTSGVGGAQDSLAIRWTVEKAGDAMELTAGQIIRFTIRGDLSGLTLFDAMVQGVYTT